MSDRYTVINQIGDGGTSTVYRAVDTHLNRSVAMKIIKPEHKAVDAAIRESLTLSSLNHPNIVSVYDVGQFTDGSQFIVMELLDGTTLEETVANGPLRAEDLNHVAKQVLSGLAAAHSAGFLHRDIKPSNIMFTWPSANEYLVKILDFGLAKHSEQPSRQTIDHSGSIQGSIHYMAPEQFEGNPLDARTDLYQLGSTLYYAAAGSSAANGETTAQVMAAHLISRFEPLARIRPDLPLPLIHWIERLMARNPENRPPDAAAALHELLRPTESIPPPQDPPSPRAPEVLKTQNPGTAAQYQAAPTPKPRSLKYFIAAALLLTTLLFIFLQNANQSQPLDADKHTEISTVSADKELIHTSTTQSTSRQPDSTPAHAQPQPTVRQPPPSLTATVIDPSDSSAVQSNIGKVVTIRGTIQSVGQSRSGRTRYINLTNSRKDLAIAIDVAELGNAYSMPVLNSLVRKNVTATGQIREVYGTPLLYIESPDELTIGE
jgi:serine/threonine protein kinase